MLRVPLATVAALLMMSRAAGALPSVVATIHPLADLTQALGGEGMVVSTLLPAGANAHTFEPTPAQMQAMATAVLLVRVGAGLDSWADKLFEARQKHISVVTITDGVRLLSMTAHEEAHHGGDPHVWLDPILVRDHIVPALRAALIDLEPTHRAAVEERARQMTERLTALDSELRNTLAPVHGRSFIAFHSAWRYFAGRYGLEEAAAIEPFPGKEPSARDIAMLVDTARRSGLHALLVEPSFSPRVAEQIAREIGGRTYVVDPLGGAPGRDSYFDLLRYNARMLVEALQ